MYVYGMLVRVRCCPDKDGDCQQNEEHDLLHSSSVIGQGRAEFATENYAMRVPRQRHSIAAASIRCESDYAEHLHRADSSVSSTAESSDLSLPQVKRSKRILQPADRQL